MYKAWGIRDDVIVVVRLKIDEYLLGIYVKRGNRTPKRARHREKVEPTVLKRALRTTAKHLYTSK